MRIPAIALSLAFLGAGCAAAPVTPAPPAPAPEQGAVTAPPETEGPEGAAAPEIAPKTEVKTFKVTAKSWSFDPSEIRVREGDRVRIEVTSMDVAHGLAIPAFKVNESFNKGETRIIEFTADKKGSYPFFCSVFCGEGHGQMRGTLIVE